MTERTHRLVSRLEDEIAALEIDFSKAYWDSQIEATPENDRLRSELEIELRKLKGDPTALHQVEAALGEDVHEPILRRQLEVLRLSLTGNQMSDQEREQVVELATAVESDFASHRAVVDGERYSDNEIEEILKASNDVDFRRRVWTASKGIGHVVSERVRELVRVRNNAARNMGFADFYQMELDLQELLRRVALRDDGRPRATDGRAFQAMEGRARRGASQEVRRHRSLSVALRGPVLPVASARRSREPRRDAGRHLGGRHLQARPSIRGGSTSRRSSS